MAWQHAYRLTGDGVVKRRPRIREEGSGKCACGAVISRNKSRCAACAKKESK